MVPGRLPRCSRILMLVSTNEEPQKMVNAYLRELVNLPRGYITITCAKS